MQKPSIILKAKLFRGLADPSRLAILEGLRAGEKTVSEVVNITRLSQPNASAHLACLRDCGLVRSRQEGRHVFYALSDPHMETLIEAAEEIISGVSERISCCSNYDCQTSQKCQSGKKCLSSAQVLPSLLNQGVVTIPLTTNQS